MGLFDIFKSKKNKVEEEFEETLIHIYSEMNYYANDVVKAIPKEKFNPSANQTIRDCFFLGAFDIHFEALKMNNIYHQIGMFSAFLGNNFYSNVNDEALKASRVTFSSGSSLDIFIKHRKAGKEAYIKWLNGEKEITKLLFSRLY